MVRQTIVRRRSPWATHALPTLSECAAAANHMTIWQRPTAHRRDVVSMPTRRAATQLRRDISACQPSGSRCEEAARAASAAEPILLERRGCASPLLLFLTYQKMGSNRFHSEPVYTPSAHPCQRLERDGCGFDAVSCDACRELDARVVHGRHATLHPADVSWSRGARPA